MFEALTNNRPMPINITQAIIIVAIKVQIELVPSNSGLMN